MEPVPDGLSANGMCVFVTSQRESTFHHLILLLQMFLSLLLFSEGCLFSSRLRCLRWISCCRTWRSWVAPAATRRRTRQLQSALPAWLIRERRVSLSVLPSSLFLSNMRTKLCHLTAAVMVSSSDDSLDSLIQSTMKRVYSVLDSKSSSVRTQAFTLMIWVRVTLFLRLLYDCQNVWTDN